jgi:hypothetical protein
MTGAIDRSGMTEALLERSAAVAYGDLAFFLGVPVLVQSARVQNALARALLPVVTQLPFSWIYSTGSSQDRNDETSERYARFYAWADVIAGDWHLIRRYAPADLSGKIVLTNTTTREDVAFLARHGVARLITTTPRYEGRSLATNLLEAAFVGIRGRTLGREDYEALLDELDYRPTEAVLEELPSAA